mmetsp:Transcript_5244/g.7703  ORF Transcript_5244/g.7703 Transcript_5244/m.7703 type:complete len:81 (-) Transcript_5244:86-328(-)
MERLYYWEGVVPLDRYFKKIFKQTLVESDLFCNKNTRARKAIAALAYIVRLKFWTFSSIWKRLFATKHKMRSYSSAHDSL